MDTKEFLISTVNTKKGTTKRFPVIARPETYFPSLVYEQWRPEVLGSYCGAGTGIGDLIVPETVWGLYVTLACYIHDDMWEHAEPTRSDFEQSNEILRYNVSSIITNCSANRFMKHIRLYRAVTMYNAVDRIGESIFWNLKRRQVENGDTIVS